MEKEYITLCAAGLSAIASIATLVLNTKMTLSREKRSLLWKREVDRLFEIEELAGKAQEHALNYGALDQKRENYKEILREMENAAGRISRFPDLARNLRQLNHWCSVACNFPIGTAQEMEARKQIPEYYQNVLTQSDIITKRS